MKNLLKGNFLYFSKPLDNYKLIKFINDIKKNKMNLNKINTVDKFKEECLKKLSKGQFDWLESGSERELSYMENLEYIKNKIKI